MYNLIQKTIDLVDGRTITIETGKLAKQADGSVVVKMGNTMILATVVAAKEAKEDIDFMPLSVEYREKYAATGRFPGGFIKREARPSENEILTARLIDRALRPLFPSNYHAEVFVNVELISADKEIMADALAGLAASAALAVSDIPFHGPISEVRVARVNGKLMINPTFTELKQADIELVVGATFENIMMVEGEMNEVSEAEMIEAINFAHEAIKIQCTAQVELSKMVGKTVKREYCHENNNEELRAKVKSVTYDKTYALALSPNPNKHERHDNFQKIKAEFIASLGEGVESADLKLIDKYYHDVEKEAVRNAILNEGIRLDGRKTNEIRPIWSEVDYLPGTHGSAIFTRGETQSLSTVTLGTKLNEQSIDGALIQGTEKFMLHYNFPPFSTGDARPNRGTGRREIGHGNLAHRALKRMVPGEAEGNPYTIRVVSDILESNGSSSMATVCAGTLALMDAGVKLKKPVTGIAMGLITDNTGKFAVLSDILGDEDHLGDMDFKVTGTVDGITACQMDIKVDGLSSEILTKALAQAKDGRLHIMGKILETIQEPRAELKPHAPRIERIIIPKDMIGAVIGPGGKIIQEIQASTGSIIVLEEVGNTGVVDIFSNDKDSITRAMARIKAIVVVPEVGEVYDAKVKTIMPYGAFVEFVPGKEGLLHISEIEWRRLNTVEEVLKEGDIIQVKLLEVDKSGKYKLSRKVLLPRPPREEQAPAKKEEN
ncbi:MAG TPA: polyribonucleotide nucleotidyltransferase [Bacteroidales bacterium]|nr:MAG: polyribonucleotide nucleotidyltransferase [Bacteroidetes bacterium GWF2_33_38]OFY72770.1 MAG: polyribonucleotide nucleotidyltransferase [Bacteroidetes bacterium RIFOXYA12_FULL_33_9]OFY90618.1 MAG: polyribonucleotide nucleotidyltransferase [Bacteroidetes bacterium RIFOXYA2_FULL_33_7]HBF87127.1 polyribonucleotide nucleotidyltransferase [Bacteroidales bacterium]